MGHNMLQKYMRGLQNHPYLALVIPLLLIALLSTGTAQLSFRSDERVFFAEDNPHLQRLDTFQKRYGKDNNLLIVAHVKGGQIFQPKIMHALTRITEDLWTAPWVKRVDTPLNFQRAVGNASGMSVDQLWRQGDDTSPQYLQELASQADALPLMKERLLNNAHNTALLAIDYRIPDEHAEKAPAMVVKDMRQRLETYAQQYPALSFYLSGSLALDAAFGEASASDSARLIPAMFFAFLALLWLMLRSWLPLLAVLLVVSGAIGSALGLGGLLSIPLSSVSVASPFIITIIALADTVHFTFAAMLARRKGLSSSDAVAQALSHCTKPIVLTSITTACGFFALLFSEAPPFAHMGILCGAGVLFACVFSLTVVPAIMILIPWKACIYNDIYSRVFFSIGQRVSKQPALFLLLALLPALALCGGIFKNVLDDRYIHYFDERFEFRRHTDILNQELGGFYTLEYDLKAGAFESIADPEYLQAVDEFATWLRNQNEVTHVASHADRIKMIHQALYDGEPAAYKIPQDPDVSAQILALYEMQLPYGMDLKQQVTVDHSASRMTVSLKDLSTGQMLSLAERAQTWLSENQNPLQHSKEATGSSLMFAYIGMRNIHNMIWGTLTAFLTIGIILMLTFRHAGNTGIAFFANVLPGFAAIGGWGMIVGEVGMSVATIVALTLGIVVDDTLHLMTAIQRKRKQHNSIRLAVPQALAEAGPGVFATTLCLILGFGLLALSGFQINAWLGLMTAIVALIALLFDFLFIPGAMILWEEYLENKSPKKGKLPMALQNP